MPRAIYFAILLFIATTAIFAIPVLAATAGTGSLRLSGDSFPDFTFQIPFGTMTSIDGDEMVDGTAIATYIGTVYQWGVAFAAVLAVLAFTYAGVLWLIAGGDSGKVTESKKVMGNALIGLLLAMGSYLLLWMVKPELVEFAPIRVTPIKTIDASLTADDGESGKPVGFKTAAFPTDPCDPTAFSNSKFSFLFGTPVYAAVPIPTDPCILTEASLKQFGLPKAKDNNFIAYGRTKDQQLWDIKNGGVKDGIVRAAQALDAKYGKYDYEGLIGMWAAHEMQFNQYASACGTAVKNANHVPLNYDCPWPGDKYKDKNGDTQIAPNDNYQVGLGVHTAQIAYLEEAFTQMEGSTNINRVRAVAQRVINGSGKGGHATLTYVTQDDLNNATSLTDLIQKAKRGDTKSRRVVITLMRDPGIGAYLIGKHLTQDNGDFKIKKLGDIMRGWGDDGDTGYQKQKMSDLFASWYTMKKAAS